MSIASRASHETVKRMWRARATLSDSQARANAARTDTQSLRAQRP